MALRKTKLLNITSVSGISTIGILTAGTTTTDAGTAGTCYVKNIIMHNTGLGTARVSLFLNPDTSNVDTGYGHTANKFLTLDLAANETTFFESTYPIVLTSSDSLSVAIDAPDVGGTGIGSAVNFIVNGDTDIT